MGTHCLAEEFHPEFHVEVIRRPHTCVLAQLVPYDVILLQHGWFVAQEKKINLSIASTETTVQIMVEDSGPGLSSGIETKAFDPFFTTKARGTGLGLSIANEIVRAHQGKLTLSKQQGGGTVAELSLPRLANDSQTAPLMQRHESRL
jgi:signal transduction histidine kinase